jgi:hypothetical protein
MAFQGALDATVVVVLGRLLAFLPQLREAPVWRCIHESAAATCDLTSMAITAKDLLRLYASLAEHRALPYDARLVPTCFDYGIFLAHGGMDLPHWLTTAPHWARSAVAVGQSSALRAIKQDQQFTMAAF